MLVHNSLPTFPLTALDALYTARLTTLVTDFIEAETVSHLSIRYCHRASSGQFILWAGFHATHEDILIAESKGEAKRPVLIFGMHAANSIPVNDDTAILDWLGVRYLRYDASDEELLSAYRYCLAGSTSPLPEHLQANPKSLLRLFSEVRHMFNTRKITVLYRLNQLENAILATPEQSTAQLPPVFTEDQRRMVNRFQAHERVADIFMPEQGGVLPLVTLLQLFVEQWAQAGQLVQSAKCGSGGATRTALDAMREIQETICKIIDLTQTLELSLGKRLER